MEELAAYLPENLKPKSEEELLAALIALEKEYDDAHEMEEYVTEVVKEEVQRPVTPVLSEPRRPGIVGGPQEWLISDVTLQRHFSDRLGLHHHHSRSRPEPPGGVSLCGS